MQCKLRFPLLQHMISISWYTQHVPRPGPSPPRRFWPLPRPAPHCGEGGVPRPAPPRRFLALPLPAPPRPVKKIASPPIPGEQMQTPLNVSLILMGVGITEHWTQSMLSFVLLVLVPLTSGKGWTWTCDPDTSFCRFLIFSLFWVSQKCLNTFHLNAKNHVDTRYEMSKPSQERVAHQWHSFAR